jgi:MFS superfamily sulfate permease-like transporter/tellurite resistance protein TehA-like permease
MLAAIAVWGSLLVAYLAKWIRARAEALGELRDPLGCGLVGLVPISTALMALAVAPYSAFLATGLFIGAAAIHLAFAVNLAGTLRIAGQDQSKVVHLIAVLGNFEIAIAAASLGAVDWGRLFFGVGLVTMIGLEATALRQVIGTLPLPASAQPALAARMAAPFLGCIAYLNVAGGAPDVLALTLFGYGTLRTARLLRSHGHALYRTSWASGGLPASAAAAAALSLVNGGMAGPFEWIAVALFVLVNIVVGEIAVGAAWLLLGGEPLSALWEPPVVQYSAPVQQQRSASPEARSNRLVGPLVAIVLNLLVGLPPRRRFKIRLMPHRVLPKPRAPRVERVSAPHSVLANVRGDIAGGLVSAAINIPLAMGYGMFALVSLGDEYFTHGAMAGLCTASVAGIASVLLGNRTTTVYAPRIISTFFLGLLLFNLVHSDMQVIRTGGLPLVLVTYFAIIFLAGTFQMLFGLARLGTLIKFAPHPVTAGFQNTAALLLFLVQLGNACGFDKTIPFTAVPSHLDSARLLSLFVAAATFIVMWNARKITTKVPPIFVGMVAGIVAYYALSALGLSHALGPIIGNALDVPISAAPLPNLGALPLGSFIELLPSIAGGGLALAIIAAVDALLCTKLVAKPGDPKMNADLLLVRLGIVNMLSAGFGGITAGLNIGASVANRSFGGRTPLSVLVSSLVTLAALLVFFPIVAHLPRVVLSAAIMVIAIQHFDLWSLRLVKRLFAGPASQRRTIMLDLLVVIAIAVLSITVHIVLAVFLGVAMAMAQFIVRMSRSNIRQLYRCAGPRRSGTSQESGPNGPGARAILVAELEGALFFGNAERLAAEIEAAVTRETRCLVLDLRQIAEMDSTGARVIAEMRSHLASEHRGFALCVTRDTDTAERLAHHGVFGATSSLAIFVDVERAIGWAQANWSRSEAHELEHNPRRWASVPRKAHAQTANLERDDGPTRNHLAPACEATP